MPTQALALSGGRYAPLLNARNAVLKQAGYQVVSAFSTLELLERFFAGDYDLVILCNSFTLEDQRMLRHAIHEYSPSTPVIAIGDGQMSSLADLEIPGDPDSLVKSLATLWDASEELDKGAT